MAEQSAAKIGLEFGWFESTLAGGSASRNFFRLIRYAPLNDCDFVALADQDDICKPDRFTRAIGELDRQNADAYSASVIAFWPNGRKRLLKQSPHIRSADFLYEGAGQGCTFVFRREAFDRLREKLVQHADYLCALHYHDWTLYALARALGIRWIFDEQPALYYRQHDSNDTGARLSLAGVKKRVRLVFSGWYRTQVEAIAAFCKAVTEADQRPIALRTYAEAKPTSDSGLIARLRWSQWIINNSRRKLHDRVILVVAALLGYL